MRVADYIHPITAELGSEPQFSEGALQQLLELFDEFEIDTLAEAQAMADRADELKTERHTLPEQAQRKRARIADELAAGHIDAEAAAGELVAAEALSAGHMATMLDQSIKVARRHAWRVIVDRGEELITDLHPCVAALIGEAVSISAELPGAVVDSPTALAAGPKIAEKWRRLGEINRAWQRVHGVLDDLRARCILPYVDEAETYERSRPCFNPARYRYSRPDLLTVAAVSSARHLANAASAGAEPALFSSADVRSRQRSQRQQHATSAETDEPAATSAA